MVTHPQLNLEATSSHVKNKTKNIEKTSINITNSTSKHECVFTLFMFTVGTTQDRDINITINIVSAVNVEAKHALY